MEKSEIAEIKAKDEWQEEIRQIILRSKNYSEALNRSGMVRNNRKWLHCWGLYHGLCGYNL